MIHTWRWFGPKDRITLQQIRQTGATGIVTALHHIPNGEVWTIDEIMKRKTVIEEAGLTWEVIESIPVHEDIKKQTGNYLQYIENFKTSLKNVSKCGIYTVCYNFMPVLDWSRTDLNYSFQDGSKALKFEIKALAAFDLFLLKRPNSEKDYSAKTKADAKAYFSTLNDEEKQKLVETIIKGLPGSEESYTLEAFQTVLDSYKNIDAAKLKQNLNHFLKEVIPIAESVSVRMAIHPDDPPFSLLGLPRIVSTIDDAKELVNVVDSPSNGITLCTGSFGAGHFNDLPKIARELGYRINFAHLRNVTRDVEGNFCEDYFFNGDIDMFDVVKALVKEELKRIKERDGVLIPVRPDHGNLMFDDIGKKFKSGYSLYGRMKGLAEIRGLEIGIKRSLESESMGSD
jgi:mannonate dehydratase